MRFPLLTLLLCGLAAAQQASPERLFQEALAAQQRGDDRTAVDKYLQLIRLRPDVPEVHANLGATLAKLGRFDEAVVQYQAALKKLDNPALRVNLALAFYKKGAFADAARELEVVRPLAPAEPRVATLLADSYLHLGEPAKAVSALEPSAAAHPDDLAVAWLLGSALIRTGKDAEGLPYVERAARQGRNPEAYLLAGRTALNLNQYERARDFAEAARELNPKLPGLATLRGMVLPYVGDNAGAIEALRVAVAENPKDFDANLHLGATLYKERELAESRKYLERALAIEPASIMARWEMGRLERAEGRVEEAVKDLEAVVKAKPDWAQPHAELAALYFRLNRAEDGERERAAFDRLNQAKP